MSIAIMPFGRNLLTSLSTVGTTDVAASVGDNIIFQSGDSDFLCVRSYNITVFRNAGGNIGTGNISSFFVQTDTAQKFMLHSATAAASTYGRIVSLDESTGAIIIPPNSRLICNIPNLTSASTLRFSYSIMKLLAVP